MRSMHFYSGNYGFLTPFLSLARERPDSILGVFIRDADATTLEPLADPTGWQAMGAAGTRPSERPLVARSESEMTTQSTSSIPSFSKYNYAPASPPPNVNIDKTPQANQWSLDSVPVTLGNPEHSNTEILGAGPLSAEPEPLRTFADDQTKTPTLVSSARMGPSIVIDPPINPSRYQRLANCNLMTAVGAKFVNQPPKPTPPPSITAATSLYSHQTSSSSSLHASNGRQTSLPEAEKRRVQLQCRVYRARTQMPSHIPLRIFREPTECVEAQEILDRNT
jgi:hypothetical protein